MVIIEIQEQNGIKVGDYVTAYNAGYHQVIKMIKIICASCEREFVISQEEMRLVPPRIKKSIEEQMTTSYSFWDDR